jgi:hypothetical protein
MLPPPTAAEEAANENQITFSLPSGVLKPGFYRLTAHYLGDTNFQSHSSPFRNFQVSKVPTTIDVMPSINPAQNGGHEVLRADITADSRATSSEAGPGGNVTFTITGASGATLVCATGSNKVPVGTKSSNQGVARCDVSGMVQSADSPYTVSVKYSGNSIYVKDSGSGSFKVSPPA